MSRSPRPKRRRTPRPLDVAIVGMACRFPGAPDLVAFWKNVVAGRDCTGDVPPDRWDPGVFHDPDSSANDRVSCRRGGYLEPPIAFDPGRYGVMPLAVEGGEPEQFLILDAARAALDDAGMTGGVPDGNRVEVVIGRGNYFNRGNLTRLQHGRIVAQTLAILEALHPEWTAAELDAVRADLKASLPPFEAGTVPGQITNATAGRVSDRLDLSGASYVVDAASGSSLVAVELASRALLEGRADLAIVGGVYIQSDVDFPMVFSRLGALSRRGEARPFSATGDGAIPGEGVGVLVLKRRADAERDGDRVYALVQGVGLASDGRGAGLAAPSARGHARAIRRAYRGSGIDPATVDLVEGHGLGVPASDRAELRALRAIFPRPDRGRRTLGAVSALIGHAMPAAGMAGLIATALALHHRLLPPNPHADDPHPLLRDDDSPFALNPRLRPWTHGDDSHPRRAGVNAFGFAGMNAHAILEEHAGSADGMTPGCMPDWDTEAILIGAADRAGWVALARALVDWLDSGENLRVPLKDLAFTLNTGQAPFPFRVGMVVESAADLRARLATLIDRIGDPGCRSIRDARGTYFREEAPAGGGRLAFLFPGEGSQYPGMLADLCPHFPELRKVLDTSDRLALERNHKNLPGDELFGVPRDDRAGLWEVGTAVNVVLSSQWALYQVLIRLGLRPGAVVGHSSGEFLALAAAGVIETDRALEDRLGDLGSVFGDLEAAGLVPSASLVAVAADRARVEAACREVGESVVVAIDNCPHQVVMAGDPAGVDAVADRLRSQGVLLESLPYRRAYHTPGFADALPPLRRFFRDLPLRPPAVPVYSCAVAGPMGSDAETIRRLAVDQWVSPVAFRSTVEAMYADGVRLFVEVGARGNLTGFVEDTLRGRPHFAVAANVPRRSGLAQLNHLVAGLYAEGVPIRPDHLYARRRPLRIDLAADLPVPNPGPPLAVGFPEMRLSEALVSRLRDRNHAPHHRNGKAPTNGHAEGLAPLRKEPANLAPTLPPDRVHAPADGPLLSYFQTMERFLETQREVMEAYLGARPAAEVHRVDDPNSHANGNGKADAFAPALDPPAAVPAPAPAPAPADDVRDLLLEQVSRRTGYPREMLDLDYDMEADLGIDSIKRVEILGELQARGVVPDGTDMDRLSRCRTLGQVLTSLGGVAPKNVQTSTEAPVSWVGDIERHVPGRELVATRRLDARDDPVASHHTLGGRRISAVEPDRLGLPVVPFTVMTEILAQAAAVLVPGAVVVGLKDVQANRWLAYDDGPVTLEVHAERDPSKPDEVRVTVRNRGNGAGTGTGSGEPTVSGVVVFGDRRETGPVAPPFATTGAGACRFTAAELYEDQWLFHGPALRALTRVGGSSRLGIEGTLTVLPRRDLLPERLWPTLHTDPIVLDAFTHLLGCWGLDKKAGEEGDVIFPLRLASLTVFGADPPEGSAVECRIRVVEVSRHLVKVDADLVGPDGRVWVSIAGWEDWRFYWPDRYRDVFRQPDSVLVGEPLPLPGPGPDPGVAAVWLEPPPDMARPVWGDVLRWVQLSPGERSNAGASFEWAWERIAAKDAARRLWRARGDAPVFPADLEIQADPQGRPRLRSLADPHRSDMPALAMASAPGVALAVASLDPDAMLGIAVESLDGQGEWDARMRCARSAAGVSSDAEALGLSNISGFPPLGGGIEGGSEPARTARNRTPPNPPFARGGVSLDALTDDGTTGEVHVRAADGFGVRCFTARRGEHVWAWTRFERTDP